MSASSQLSCPPDANSAVVYKTAALPARTLCTPVSFGVPARPAQGHGLATDPGHSFAARDRVANVRRSSSVSRTTTGKGIRDSGLQTASFILPAPDRTASPFGADSDWRTGMADMCAVHDAPRLIVLEHRVGDLAPRRRSALVTLCCRSWSLIARGIRRSGLRPSPRLRCHGRARTGRYAGEPRGSSDDAC